MRATARPSDEVAAAAGSFAPRLASRASIASIRCASRLTKTMRPSPSTLTTASGSCIRSALRNALGFVGSLARSIGADQRRDPRQELRRVVVRALGKKSSAPAANLLDQICASRDGS